MLEIIETSLIVEATIMLSIDDHLTPVEFALHQNYPNPFNPTTQIKYDLPEDVIVTIAIYDVMGRNIRNLMNLIRLLVTILFNGMQRMMWVKELLLECTSILSKQESLELRKKDGFVKVISSDSILLKASFCGAF